MGKTTITLIALALLVLQVSWAYAEAYGTANNVVNDAANNTTDNVANGTMNVDWIKQRMIDAAVNLTTYSYAVNSETNASYSNSSSSSNVTVISKSQGAVDMLNKAATSSMFLETMPRGEESKVDLLEVYFVNGTDYTNWNGNWSSNAVSNITEGMKAHNEIVQQVNLINMSDMEMVGTEELDGHEVYVLRGSPSPQLYRTYLALALESAYASSPISLPRAVLRASRDINSTSINSTGLLENGEMVLTIWVDKNTYRLKKNTIETKVSANPEILNLTGEENFTIMAETAETSTFTDFGAPVLIALPDGAGVAGPLLVGRINSTGCIACQKS
jgi:hypothetical protein